MKIELNGRVSVVTGAARGIGLAICERLAEAGSDLAMLDIQEETVRSSAGEVSEKYGVKARAWKVDVSSFSDVERVMGEIVEEFGRIDVLVNNAGITRDNLLMRMSESEWDSVLSVNLKGAFNCMRHVARAMMRQKSGSIVNIASVVGLMGNAGQANYSASKAGMVGLTKSVARELASKGVRVNAVAPGFIKTEMTDKIPQHKREELISAIPMKSLGTPGDIADVVLFLASGLSSYITGECISVNGGMYM